MEFDGETIKFDVFKDNQNLIENQSISTINMVNFFDVQELSELMRVATHRFNYLNSTILGQYSGSKGRTTGTKGLL